MENDKWYTNALLILLVTLLSPFILIAVGLYVLIEEPKEKKKYENTPYYKQFKCKYSMGIIDSAKCRFYNSVIHHRLPIIFHKDAIDFDFFIYNGTIYYWSSFNQITWDDEQNKLLVWYRSDNYDLDSEISDIKVRFKFAGGMPIKIITDRVRVNVDNLTDTPLPDDIYVTWSYDDAFLYDDNPFMTKLPFTTVELYETMLKILDLCGELELDGELIKWRLYDGYLVELSLDEGSGYMSVNRKTGITHWHPSSFELCDTVLKMTSRGNVLVIRSRLFSSKTLYCGKKADCLYSPEQKPFLGKMYFLETV